MTNNPKQFNIAFIADKTIQTNYIEKFKKEFEYFEAFESIVEYKRAKNNTAEVLLIEETGNESDLVDLVYELRNTTHKHSYIYILSNSLEEFYQLALFNAGANDVLEKNVRVRILIAKVTAIKNFQFANPLPDEVNANKKDRVYLNKEKYTVSAKGKEHVLPKKEYDLLNLLLSKADKVFTREDILTKLWGSNDKINDRIIDVHIRKLREKVGQDFIKTVKGVGYYINE